MPVTSAISAATDKMLQGYVIASLALVNSKITIDGPSDVVSWQQLEAACLACDEYVLLHSTIKMVLRKTSQLGTIKYEITTHIDMDSSPVVRSSCYMIGPLFHSPCAPQLWPFYMLDMARLLRCSKEHQHHCTGPTSVRT